MIDLNKKIQEQFNKMAASGKLFRVELTGREVWDLYLTAFTPENNPVFRDPVSSSHNCNHCKNFIRRYGNVVAIIDNQIVSMFDIKENGEYDAEYRASMHVLSESIRASKVSEVFFETFLELNALPYESCTKKNEVFRLGINENHKRYTKEEAEKYGVVTEGEIRTFNHFHLDLPKLYVDMGSKSVEAIMAEYRSAKEVFQRAMDELNIDTLHLVKDLINQGSLLDGTTHLYKVEAFIKLMEEYDELSPKDSNNWCWVKSYQLPLAKFKNELIGVLCTELAEGTEINAACQAWNKRVDPVNYMKTTAPITKKQIEEAKQFVEENGYVESFNRRFATIDDIKASEILHMNGGKGEIKEVSIFDGVKSSTTRHKRNEFDGVAVVDIEDFMKDILPGCTSVEAFLINKHSTNFASLTTANDKESKPIFKWDNNYSWTFNGNLAGKSLIKEAVMSRGGKTTGVLNIRMHFPETESDYDLHVQEPAGGAHIYYGNRRMKHASTGMLDLDAQGADGHFSPEKRVENIIYTDSSKMRKGKHKVYVHNFSRRDKKFGFIIEIEIDGEVTTFRHDKDIADSGSIHVCDVHWDGKEFTIDPQIPVHDSNTLTTEIYGLETNQFHKVNLVCLSPNHWDTNNVGNKHYFFMLEGAQSPTDIRSFHNENLLPELAAHRKVLEVLGATNMIPSTPKQLSGLGFNSTVEDELIVKLQGSHKRTVRIKF